MELLDHPITPWILFKEWFSMAQKSEPSNPEAMSLATVDNYGIPQLRTVLMKKIVPQGLIFFTNKHSIKGQNMVHQPEVSVLFYWRTLDLQIRINGSTKIITDQMSDDYFSTRPRISQIGAWSSNQSQLMKNPETLAIEVEKNKAYFTGKLIPRPSYWCGYCISPWRFEFWIQKEGRLHQRLEYTRKDNENAWNTSWVFP